MSKHLVKTVMSRGGIQLYKAMDNQSKGVVVIGVLQKNEENAALLKEMEQHKDGSSKFLLECYGYCEREHEYWVVFCVKCKG